MLLSQANLRTSASRTIALLALCIVIASMAACGMPFQDVDAEAAPAESRKSPLVSEGVFQRAFNIVSSMEYVPFRYQVDGCYARALYMALELASERIESNAVFAFAQPEAPLVVGDIEWSYHVAPLLMVQEEERTAVVPRVLDPSLSDEPVELSAWIGLMGHALPDENQRGASQPVDDVSPTLLVVPGSRYAPDEALEEQKFRNVDLPNFKVMPSFRLSDIRDACLVLHDYLALDPSMESPEQVAHRQDQLVERTQGLVASLEQLEKIDADSAFTTDGWWTESLRETACHRAVESGHESDLTRE